MSYIVLSDIHAHRWSLFAKTNADGVNGRLQIILDEMLRAAKEALSNGVDLMVIAGDILHVRGSIDPEVLNPLQETIRAILNLGMDIIAIPGNHDLAGKETTVLGNAIKTLAETNSPEGTFILVDEPQFMTYNVGDHERHLAFVPWCSSVSDLLEKIDELREQMGADVGSYDLVIHAGIDGVLPNMPDHGLSPKTLADFGFRNVFAGHYHNHKAFEGGVYSIGATTHQTWGDIGSRAGYLTVENDGSVKFSASHAPRFVDVTGLDQDDMALAATGNYVRFSGKDMTPNDVTEIRKFFADNGALGVSVLATKKAAAGRRPGAAKSGASLDESVTAFVDNDKDMPTFVDRSRVKSDCADVLAKARSVHEEA
jgi:DNA repair exonuclease SbcCD nuclease subunit